MKTLPMFTCIFFALSIIAQPANSSKTKIKSKSEDVSIINTMKAETTAFYANDYIGWKSHWLQSENSIVAYNNIDGSYQHLRGWQKINKVFEEMIKERTEEAHPDFNVGDLDIEINGDMAFVIYNEYVANLENRYSKVPGIKTLKKVNGKWKLHSVISFWDRNYQYSLKEVREFIKDNGIDQFK